MHQMRELHKHTVDIREPANTRRLSTVVAVVVSGSGSWQVCREREKGPGSVVWSLSITRPRTEEDGDRTGL